MAVTITLDHKDPSKLKAHPLNAKIYGDAPDAEFVESCKLGINEPLVILPSDTVISGHRRMQAARLNKHAKVPVVIRHDLTDPLEIERLLIESNRQREKTAEQRLREGERLKEIVSEQAEIRRKSSLTTNGSMKHSTVGVPVPQPSKPQRNAKSAEIAAKEVGLSEKTLTSGIKVVHAIDEAEKSGDKATAEELRETLNNKGVKPALKLVVEREPGDESENEHPAKKPPKPYKNGAAVHFDDKPIDKHLGQMTRLLDDRAKFQGGQGKHHAQCLAALNRFCEHWNAWKKAGKGAK